MSQPELDDMAAQNAIAAQKRLEDHAWAKDPAYHVYIDHDVLYDIMTGAERLAKRCLWQWVRTHRPDELPELGYLSDVDFGREVLSTWMNRLPLSFFEYRLTKPYQISEVLLTRLIPL